MKEPLISLIVPVYNVEQYLDRCVQSLVCQTYPNLEILLVDDGSTDGSGAACDTWAKRDHRVRVIHQVNRGLSGARNSGVTSATGEYISFVDSDDYILPNFTETLLGLLEKSDAQIAICDYRKFDDSGPCRAKGGTGVREYDSRDALEAMLYQKALDVSACGRLLEASIARRILFPEGRLFEDLATTYLWYHSARKIIHTNQKLYMYYQRPQSIMNRSFSSQRLDLILSTNEMFTFITGHYPGLLPAAVSRRFSNDCQTLLRMPRDRNLYTKERAALLARIKADCGRMLINPHVRAKNRLAALAVLLGGGRGLALLGKISGMGEGR